MITTAMRMKLNKKILLIFIITTLIATSCNKNHTEISKEESSIETTKENTPIISDNKNENDNVYKYKDTVINLIKEGKIFDIKVDSKITNDDIYIYVILENDKINLKDLDIIRIGISVQEFKDELSTSISNLDKSKKYWEIKLNEGILEEVYDINISEKSDLLTDKDKELLMSNNESTILRFDVYVDEDSPVRIYNHFLN